MMLRRPRAHGRTASSAGRADDVEQFQRAAVAGGVELEVQGPDMVGALGPQPLGGHAWTHRAVAACVSAAAPVQAWAYNSATPFAGPKPESMMVPCGARRSGQSIRVGSSRRADSFQVGHTSSILVTRSNA